MPFGIILLPPQPIADALVDLSQRIAAQGEPIMALQAGVRPPHLTLLHVDAEPGEADSVWRSICADPPSLGIIELTGLRFNELPVGGYYVPEGGIYYGLDAERSDALQAAHDRIVEVNLSVGLQPLGLYGNDFDPHVTLGVLRQPLTESTATSDVITASFVPTIALGELGPYGTFPRIIDTVPPS